MMMNISEMTTAQTVPMMLEFRHTPSKPMNAWLCGFTMMLEFLASTCFSTASRFTSTIQIKIILVISSEIKSGQMSVRASVRPCGVNIFKTLRLDPRPLGRGRWNLARTFYWSRNTTTRQRILNFGPCAAWWHPELSRVGGDDLPRAECLCSVSGC